MKVAVFYDTETTDMPLWREPSEDPRQPHIIQLAAVMVDLDTRQHLQSIKLLVRPSDWEISAEAEAVHGISKELAQAVGVAEEIAVGNFISLLIENMDDDLDPPTFRLRIAHSISFDDRIMRIALKRYVGDEEADQFKAGPSYCTLTHARQLMNLPGKKLPTLAEAYKHFTGKELVGAHDAMVDTLACIEVYFAIQDLLAQAA